MGVGEYFAGDALERLIEERFITASGPGGQNVNKVATAVQLRVSAFRLGLAPDVYQRLKQLAGARMTSGGDIVITARRFRTQDANRVDARARLAELLARAHERQAKRVNTKPSKAARARRIDAKTSRGAVKAARGKVRMD